MVAFGIVNSTILIKLSLSNGGGMEKDLSKLPLSNLESFSKIGITIKWEEMRTGGRNV
jgi:hypothetical protein